MAEVCVIDWHVHFLRADRFLEAWTPAAERALAFGASSYSLIRSEDDPHHFVQTSLWEDRADFERYWYSDELTAAREAIGGLHNVPVLPKWNALVAAG